MKYKAYQSIDVSAERERIIADTWNGKYMRLDKAVIDSK
jgi:hypothetical protein